MDETSENKDKEQSEDTEAVIERAKKRLTRMVNYMRKAHEIGKRCIEFVGGEQWEEEMEKSRKASKKPVITINKLDNYVNIVVNKNSQERSRIKVLPFEDADVDTAKVVNGLIRHIQYSDKSDAGEAYSKAFFNLVSMGFGYARVDTEYCDDMSVTEQEIVIKPIDDALSVYLDPKGKFAIVVHFIPKDEFIDEYGEHDTNDWDVDLKGDCDDDVMLVEYWEKTEKEVEIYSIEIPEQIIPEMQQQVPMSGVPVENDIPIDDAINNTVYNKTPLPSGRISVIEDELQEYLLQYPDIDTSTHRTTKISTVKQYLFSGNDQLKKMDWAGKYIPIVGCYGRKFKTRAGEIFFKPLVFNAIDPQIYYNFLKSQDAEIMMAAPKSPWIGAEGQFDGHEDEWSKSNTSSIPYLEYKPVDLNGQLAPPPQRSGPPQVNAAFYQNMMQANDEIKACIGMHDASVGATGNETSGKAIIARKQQGDLATLHFTNASNTMLRDIGIIVVDLRPHIYDSARTIRILGEDMTDEVVKINQPFVNSTGKLVNYDMKQGTYDIKIETGPSNITRRLENFDIMVEAARVIPSIGLTSPDLIIRNMDHEYGEEMALRAKASLDPAMIARAEQLKNSANGGPTPEQIQLQKMQEGIKSMQMQLQKDQQIMQGMAKQNEALKNKINQADIIIAQVKAQSEIRKEQIESAADVEVARINNGYRNTPIPVPAVAPAGNRPNMAMAYPDGRRQ